MSLAFVRGIHRWPVNSTHKGPVTRKMFPIDDVIMACQESFLYAAYKSSVMSSTWPILSIKKHADKVDINGHCTPWFILPLTTVDWCYVLKIPRCLELNVTDFCDPIMKLFSHLYYRNLQKYCCTAWPYKWGIRYDYYSVTIYITPLKVLKAKL